jgi:hypothetical protein
MWCRARGCGVASRQAVCGEALSQQLKRFAKAASQAFAAVCLLTHRGFQVEAVHRIGEVVVVARASQQLVGLWAREQEGSLR